MNCEYSHRKFRVSQKKITRMYYHLTIGKKKQYNCSSDLRVKTINRLSKSTKVACSPAHLSPSPYFTHLGAIGDSLKEVCPFRKNK